MNTLTYRTCQTLAVAALLALTAVDCRATQPPIVVPPSGGVGLNVPLDTNLNVSGWGVNQFLGNGFLFDGTAARTTTNAAQARFARYQTSVQGQIAPTALPINQDWAFEIGYKHTGGYSSINSPFFLRNFGNDDRIVALFNNGGDSWSLGVGNASNGYDMVASQLQLGTGWNRFNVHYKAATQSLDLYLNNKLVAADATLGHGQYNPNHVQIEFSGAGTEWYGEIKAGNAIPRTRSVTFGNEWVRSHPFTVHALVARDNALVTPLYKNAHFTDVIAWENNVGLVDKAWEIQGLPWQWHTGERPLSPELTSQIDTWMAQRPGGQAFQVWDEPTRVEFDEVRDVTNWIKENYPQMLVYGNISTIGSLGYDYDQEYGSEPNPPPVPYDYPTFVDDYMYVVQPDILQFDLYPISDEPGNLTDVYYRDRYFLGVDTIRAAGQKYNVPTFIFIQTFDGGGTRLPSESELRFQIFAPLAYGFKGISYFLFDHFGAYADGNQGGMLRATDPNETQYAINPIYYDVKEVNPEISRLGESLKMMDSTKVRFILGKRMQGGVEVSNVEPLGITHWNPVADEPYITSLQASYIGGIPDVTRGDLLIGHFETAVEEADGPQFQDERYFMLVNLLMDETQTATQQIHMEFNFGASGITSLQRLSRLTGQVELVPLIHDGGSLYHLDFSLAGGTGDLFKYNTGAPFIGGFVVNPLPGDYNRDGAVDTADYIVWRKTMGQYVTRGDGADGDGDGIIGVGDKTFWRQRFGNTGGAGGEARANAPEPGAIVLACIVGVGLLVLTHRTRRLGAL